MIRVCGVALLAAMLSALMVATASGAPTLGLSMRSSDHDDVQAVYVEATTGQFRLQFGVGGQETGDLPATATAKEVEDALNALPNLGAGSVSVVKSGFEPSNGLDPYLVTFSGGGFGGNLQPLMRAKGGTVPLGDSPLGGLALAYVETRVPGGFSRSDERVDYRIDVNNAAVGGSNVGDELFCNGKEPPKEWFPGSPGDPGFPTFSFTWVRNGEVIPGETAETYTVTAADQGKVVQCLVKGSNDVAAAIYAALPTVTVSPAPAISPPSSENPLQSGSRPDVTGSGLEERTCAPPANWLPNPPNPNAPTYTFQWLRNAEPIPGASSSAYSPTAEDENTQLQCQVLATNAGGAIVGVSEHSVVGTLFGNPASFFTQTPEVVSPSWVSGAVSVDVELPSGAFVYSLGTKGSGWSCVGQAEAPGVPAKATCTRTDVLAPGAAFPPLTVAVGLGDGVPDVSEMTASASGGGAANTASATAELNLGPEREFGFIPGRFSARALDSRGDDYVKAGGHPSLAVASFSFNRLRQLIDDGQVYKRHRPIATMRDIRSDVPAGFIGNPRAIPELCPSTAQMVSRPPSCPPESAVGELAFQAQDMGSTSGLAYKRMPLYAMVPEKGAPAEFAAAEPINGGVYVVIPRLRPEDGYAISLDALGNIEVPEFTDIRVTLCGLGARMRLVPGGDQRLFSGCNAKGDPGAYAKPFLTTQTECSSESPVTRLHMDSWLNPGKMTTASSAAPPMIDCESVPFEPKLDLRPTAQQAESSTGLDVDLAVPTAGFENPDGRSQAHLKKTTVTLPPGMSVNPSSADGLGACTQAQLGMVNGVPNNEPVNCPDASKIGTAVVKTPILEETLEGDIYLAKQGDNPFGTLVAIYVVVESKERGILIKLPGKVEFRPGGQIVSTFDDNPQAPFSSLELSFNSGPRAALMTPQRCGSYQIVSQMTPWSAADPDNPTPAETVTQTSSFDVTSGPNGGPCPTGALLPKVTAGIQTPMAGSSSPFVFRLSRDDGTQRFNGLTMALPPGLAANLRGVPYCSDATLASIPSAEGTGAAEIANPSCPAASRIGSVSVGAGAGNPFYVNTGSAYLAGPYKGAPLSLAVVIPAVAGPFDLGNVVVRNAVLVNPQTAQVSIKSDPLPTQLHNLPVDVRDVRVVVDRPGFMQAPTNCEEMRIDAVISGEEGASAPVSNRFQVGECGSLDFGPKLKMHYKGATKRGGNPGLRAVLTQPGGQANISRTVVILPKGSFIDNAHINNPCTRAQYAAEACPKASILGRATAWSPLLDEPLTGNVYFRSNGGERELPDVVASLRGQVNVELVGFVDSVVNKKTNTSRVRNTFAVVPDAPVSRFVLNLQGGKRGLIENSRNLCLQKNTADVKMSAHNGKRHNFKPVIQTDCKKKKSKQSKKKSSKK